MELVKGFFTVLLISVFTIIGYNVGLKRNIHLSDIEIRIVEKKVFIKDTEETNKCIKEHDSLVDQCNSLVFKIKTQLHACEDRLKLHEEKTQDLTFEELNKKSQDNYKEIIRMESLEEEYNEEAN